MTKHDPLDGLWMQQTLTPMEHPVLTIRLGANLRRKVATIGVKVHDGDNEELMGMWAGPAIPVETLEAQAATVLAIMLDRLGLDLRSQDPF